RGPLDERVDGARPAGATLAPGARRGGRAPAGKRHRDAVDDGVLRAARPRARDGLPRNGQTIERGVLRAVRVRDDRLCAGARDGELVYEAECGLTSNCQLPTPKAHGCRGSVLLGSWKLEVGRLLRLVLTQRRQARRGL